MLPTAEERKKIWAIYEESPEQGHDKLAQPIAGCFCFDCCEKRYSEKETVKTKIHRNEGF